MYAGFVSASGTIGQRDELLAKPARRLVPKQKTPTLLTVVVRVAELDVDLVPPLFQVAPDRLGGVALFQLGDTRLPGRALEADGYPVVGDRLDVRLSDRLRPAGHSVGGALWRASRMSF
jgi:hypothetical protein